MKNRVYLELLTHALTKNLDPNLRSDIHLRTLAERHSKKRGMVHGSEPLVVANKGNPPKKGPYVKV